MSEERLHTEPVWRLLPDLEPIVDPNDQRLRSLPLAGGCWWERWWRKEAVGGFKVSMARENS